MQRVLLVVAMVLVAVLVVAGCAPPAPPVPPESETPSETASLELFGPGMLPLADGQDVRLEAGAQGGFHVWLQYCVDGMAAQPTELLRTARLLADDRLVLKFRGAVELGPSPFEGEPLPMFMCPSPLGISVVDVPIVFQLELGAIKRSITLVPHCPEGEREFCQRICTG